MRRASLVSIVGAAVSVAGVAVVIAGIWGLGGLLLMIGSATVAAGISARGVGSVE